MSKNLVNVGDRIAQLIIEKLTPVELEVTDELEKTERGELGFGSTGVKAQIEVDSSQNTTKIKSELQVNNAN